MKKTIASALLLFASCAIAAADANSIALGVNPYDYVVFKPKMPKSGKGLNPADRGDRYNDHFQVIYDSGKKTYYAFWTQASSESHIDQHIAFSKSTDGLNSWSEPVVLAGSENKRYPRLMASWQQPLLSKKGRLYLLWNQQVGAENIKDEEMYGTCSDDCGESWKVPQKVAKWPMAQFPLNGAKHPRWCIWQRPLRLGPSGRFYVGVSHFGSMVSFLSYDNIDDNPGIPQMTFTNYQSGDAKALRAPAIPGSTFSRKCDEASIVKLPDGRLFAIMRTKCGYICWSQSRDSGVTWDEPKLLKDENGKPYLHPCSPCPMYDFKGCEAGSGTYFALVHNTFDFKSNTAWQTRGPLYFIAGRFDADGEQPVRFGKPKLFAPRKFENSFYTSYTVDEGGQGILWFNDMKYYLLGRKIGPEWFEESK